MSDDPQHQVNGQPSLIEKIKAQSNYLRGQIAAELAQPTDHFTNETAQLLKLHGMYQQDDRDRRVLLGDLAPEEAEDLPVHGPHGDARRPADEPAASGPYRAGRQVWQRHVANHQPARPANARPCQAGPPRGAQADPRSRPDHDGHLRRRASQRRLLPGPLPQRSGPRTDPVDGRANCRGPFAADAGLWRDLARRPAGRLLPGARARDRAALRQGLSAAKVQGGPRPARRQLRGCLLPGRGPAGRVPQLRRDRLQRAGRRRHGHDARSAADLSRPGPADGLRPGRPGPRSAAGDRRRLSRLRQSQRSQAGEAEVPDRRLGPRAFQASRSSNTWATNCRRRSPTTSGTSTTTSAGASRATAAGSTACTCPAGGFKTRARCG